MKVIHIKKYYGSTTIKVQIFDITNLSIRKSKFNALMPYVDYMGIGRVFK